MRLDNRSLAQMRAAATLDAMLDRTAAATQVAKGAADATLRARLLASSAQTHPSDRRR